MRVTGTITRHGFAGGGWQLRTEGGDCYTLRGEDPAIRKEGLEVEITGTVDDAAMGIAMAGPILDVASWNPK